MMKLLKHKKLLFFCALITVAFVSCKIAFPSGSWRYKVTVEVETPEGIKSGYAVREVRAQTQSGIPNPDAARIRYKMSGEAVAVDLGKRGVLFYLFDWDSNEEIENAFPFESLDDAERIKYYSSLKIGTKADIKENYETIVTFKDLTDPKSVTLVLGEQFNAQTHKYESVNNFETPFGKGVRLKKVTLEMTDEPTTWQVKKYLPWLPNYYDRMLDGMRNNTSGSKYPLANSMASGSFSSGR